MADVLAIAGSARRNGNSDAVLDAALDVLREAGAEVEILVPGQIKIEPCRSCCECWNTGICAIRDDLTALYPRFEQAKCMVVSAPVYFASLPGHLKIMIDRFQPHWCRTFRLNDPPQPRRRGIFLCVGAMEGEHFYQCSRRVVASWMACLNMKCVASEFFPGVDARDDHRGHPEYLVRAREAARDLLNGLDSS